VWQALADGMFAMTPGAALGTTTAPTLLVAGDRDAIFSGEELEAVAAWFPGATVSVYAETGHAPHWEHPRRFAEELTAFLSERSRTSAGVRMNPR
jgi:pimeloyl-ACP methyl ester carboxylesterase